MSPWQTLLNEKAPLVLPACPDPLTALLALQAGYPALQVGMFAAVGLHRALPDLGLVQAGEALPWVREVIQTVRLPVLVDCDDGHGHAGNVVRTVRQYEAAGAAALFLEDQAAPKRCGHLSGKRVLGVAEAAQKIRAARQVLKRKTFLLARTDAWQVEGKDGCRRRADAYLDAGANGLYFEGVTDEADVEALGREYRTTPLALSVLEGNSDMPWRTPCEYHSLGYVMILYPTSLLFRSLHAIRQGLRDLAAGQPMPKESGLDLTGYDELVSLEQWDGLREL
jgi:2-methylisocitrate lyase-like PEP mutase family enzyme